MFGKITSDNTRVVVTQDPIFKLGTILTPEADSKHGTSQNDTIFGLGGRDSIWGGAGNDYIDGGDDTDWLFGEAGNDTLLGGKGDDSLMPGTGNNTVDGGDGFDVVNFSDIASGGGFTINLATGVASRIIANGNLLSIEKTTLTSIEGAVGSNYNDYMIGSESGNVMNGGSGNDQIFGNGGNDSLYGGQGDDVISGGAGNDQISGDEGNDVMTGGAGADHFVFSWVDGWLGDTFWGTVTDFNYAQGDRIDLWNVAPGELDFIGGQGFHANGTGEVRLTGGGGGTTVHIDYDGDGVEDGSLFLQGVTGLNTPGADAFIL